ncbi:hypothetical protein K3495_g16645 [Podosphaera aphanis]|nr:hypothetical protein K3495_g16645 [Podosphaera aphanis]
MFGTKPPTEQQIYPSYEREHLPSEDKSFAAELARKHAAPLARAYDASLKSARDQTRAYTQEDKALTRVYGTGDWVLRVRSGKHKNEPFYDGPWQITKSRSGNTYSLASPGGIVLSKRYNGSR